MLMLTEEVLSEEVFSRYGHVQRAITRWKNQWHHLFGMLSLGAADGRRLTQGLENRDDRFCSIKLTSNFCQLVITRRALEEHRAQRQSRIMDGQNGSDIGHESASSDNQQAQEAKLFEQWTAQSRENALQLVETFGQLPGTIVRELPDFFYLVVTYGMTVLAHFIYKPPLLGASAITSPRSNEEIAAILQDAMAHGSRTGSKTMRLFELTITRLAEALDTHPGEATAGTGNGAMAGGGGMTGVDRLLGPDATGTSADVLGFSENWVTPDLEALFNDMLPEFLVPRP